MMKKLSQCTDPAITNAAGRAVWVNSSAVKMLVTPPLRMKKYKQKSLLAGTTTAAAEEKPQRYWLITWS